VVTLTWTGAAGAESYVVEAGSSSGTSNLASFDTNSAATVFVANAPPGRYFVRVRSKRSCGISAPSNQVEILVS
jgi:hypothetical protein